MKLLIISDTPMYRSHGQVFVFEPTLTELEKLVDLFDAVTWIGFEFPGEPPRNARQDATGKISFQVIPAILGGKQLQEKVKIVWRLPRLIAQLWREIGKADIVHTRAPSVPALFGILFSFTSRRRWWHKYAGNWVQTRAPLAYALQRRLLLRASNCVVTINGHWQGLPSHFKSFENPCLTREEIATGASAHQKKQYSPPYTLCYAGALIASKGVHALIAALHQLDPNQIKELLVAGDGPERARVEESASHSPIPVRVFGSLGRQAIMAMYARSHVIILPSANEGFPKVIAEAASMGCVPVVTDVSAISQYVRTGLSGYLIPDPSAGEVVTALEYITADAQRLREMAGEIVKLAPLFSYERFKERVTKEIIGNDPGQIQV